METLIQKILRKERKPHVEKTLDVDEIEPFFQAHGIDIDALGFEFMEYRNSEPIEQYLVRFRDVILTPIKVNDVVKTIITGEYEAQARISYRDSEGHPRSGTPCKYSFRIEDGKLSLKRKRRKILF